MITIGQAKEYLRSLEELPAHERTMDAAIRDALRKRIRVAQLHVKSEAMARLLASEYEPQGWDVEVKDVSSDRVTSETVWCVSIDVESSLGGR